MHRGWAYLCIVLAAGASIATSKPRWTLEDKATTHVTLGDAHPKRTLVLTVESNHAPNLALALLVTWDADASRPGAAMRIAIVADDGSAPFHASISPFYDNAGKHVPSVMVNPPIVASPCKAPCRIRYTIELERTAGAGESVSVDANAVATIEGEAAAAPPTASVRARFSP